MRQRRPTDCYYDVVQTWRELKVGVEGKMNLERLRTSYHRGPSAHILMSFWLKSRVS
jgi:hypothetical protein